MPVRAITLALTFACFAISAAQSQTPDLVKVAVPQRGAWETAPSDIGQVKGIFARHGIKTETLYTSGGGETMQALISGSVDIAIGTGTAAVMSAFSKGAPARPIASSITGAQDIFWYVPIDSPIKSLKDAAGKSIAFSATGSSSHLATLTLIKQSGVDIKAIPTGVSAATFTQVMSGQIDIGWAAVPFGIAQLEDKRIRVVARYNDIPEYRTMTARLHLSNLDNLTRRPQVIQRFLAAYGETLDWMYQGEEAAEVFSKFYEQPLRETQISRDQFYTRKGLDLKTLGGLEQSTKDALELKFISKAFTKDELDEMFKYYPK